MAKQLIISFRTYGDHAVRAYTRPSLGSAMALRRFVATAGYTSCIIDCNDGGVAGVGAGDSRSITTRNGIRIRLAR